MLCDEVTSALDVSVQAAVLDLLNELKEKQGTTYVFVSHDLAVVKALSDRVAVLYQGRLCEIGPSNQVYATPSHPYTEVLLGAVLEPDPDTAPTLAADDVVELSPPAQGCPFQRRCPRKIGPICDTETPPWHEGGGGSRDPLPSWHCRTGRGAGGPRRSMTSGEKLELHDARVSVAIAKAHEVALRILKRAGCTDRIAGEIVDHLIDADLCGVESHGIFRTLQYAEEFRRGYIRSDAVPSVDASQSPTLHVDGQGGIGITAMKCAVEVGIKAARAHGLCAIAVRNTGHTGRLGAFCRNDGQCRVHVHRFGWWRQTELADGRAPWRCQGGLANKPMVHGAFRAVISGRWCWIAPPGRLRAAGSMRLNGPVGWCLMARSSTRRAARPRSPVDYFAGGAILPKGEALGYGLATIGELICDAMLGPCKGRMQHLRSDGRHPALPGTGGAATRG